MLGIWGLMFVRENLDRLGRKREEIERSLNGTEAQIRRVERKAIDEWALWEGLQCFNECFDRIKHNEQKELMRLVLVRAGLSEESIKIGLNCQL